MAISSEDFRIITAHLAKYSMACPVCHTNKWAINGFVSAPTYKYTDPTGEGGNVDFSEVYPAILVACRTCYYTRQFLWLPIKKEASSGIGG